MLMRWQNATSRGTAQYFQDSFPARVLGVAFHFVGAKSKQNAISPECRLLCVVRDGMVPSILAIGDRDNYAAGDGGFRMGRNFSAAKTMASYSAVSPPGLSTFNDSRRARTLSVKSWSR